MAQNRIQIDRPVFTQSSLDVAYKRREEEATSLGDNIQSSVKYACRLTPSQWPRTLLGLFPFIQHIKAYRNKWKQFLPGDITAGLTVGIMHIPTGFGFALLANMPPVYGLYTSFWCVIFYFLFGQSQHLSIGAMAIISIMLSEATNSNVNTEVVANGNQTADQLNDTLQILAPTSSANQTSALQATGKDILLSETANPVVDRTLLVSMLTGIILVIMSILKLSKIVVFVPVSCISGFTTAAAFHIVTSQVKFILGVSIQSHTGVFKFVKLWKEIILTVPETNVCDLVISICCFIVLIAIKEFINPKFKDKLPVPIPGEIIVVIIVTLVSYLAKLNDHFGIKIVNKVPAGFEAPNIPDFQGFGDYLVDAFLIAIISFVISYSMVSTFARKHKYDVDPQQEMLAYGMCHFVGAFLGSFAGAAAPPRCTVLDTTGAKSLITHIFSAVVILLTILLIGPLFEPLPNSCLAVIIVCALFPLFKQFKQLPQLWKINKYDFAIWLVTWASVVFLDIDIGLAIGVGFSLATLAVQGCLSKGTAMSTVGYMDIYQPRRQHELSHEIPGIKIFRFESSLHFASQAQFKEQLFNLTADPGDLLRTLKKTTEKLDHDDAETPMTNTNDQSNNKATVIEPLLSDLCGIVLEFSSISYIDIMGVNLIQQLKDDYSHVGISLVLANCTGATLCKLEAAGIGCTNDGSNSKQDCWVYPTIQDAVTALLCDQQKIRFQKFDVQSHTDDKME